VTHDDRPDEAPEGDAPRSSADLAPSGRSSATIGARLSGGPAQDPDAGADPYDLPTVASDGVPVVPADVAVTEPAVWGPSIYDDDSDGTVFTPGAEASPDVRWVRHRPSVGPIPRWGLVVVLLIVGTVFAFRWIDAWVNAMLVPDAPPGDEVAFVIETGWSANDVAAALGTAGVIDHPTMFRQWMRCPSMLRWLIDCPADVEYSFQAGDYVLQEHLTFQAAVDVLNEGPIPPEVVRVTVPEGLTIEQMVVRLKDRMPTYSEAQLREAFASDVVRWEHYPAEFPLPFYEGMFFPDTYQLDDATLTDEISLVMRMHAQFLAVVDEIDLVDRAAALGVTPYEALIIASLIEEEARIEGDRAKISRVIHNRIEQDWLLGIDASTRYAVGKTAGEPLTSEDLASESPWNTRAVPGLPLTPISAPGRASLEAAVAPADGPWMYYVRTDEDGVAGAHTFAVTSEEFAAAVQVCKDKNLGCG